MTSSPWNGQFMRYAQLVVSSSNSARALVVSSTELDASKYNNGVSAQLRFRFEVRASDVDTPNTMVARAYNLSESTRNTIIKEYDTVTLTAGYENGNKGNIFQGNIKRFGFGRERNVDSFLDIMAGDGDKAYNESVINQTFPAGATDAQSLSALAAAMAIPVDQMANGYLLTGGILPRGKTMFGMARVHMAELAKKNNCRWSIQNGVVTLIPESGYLPGEAIVINSSTGMIGTPESTDNGIMIRCQLNPFIKIGRAVKINNKDINQAVVKSQFGFPSYQSLYYPATVTGAGLYRVLVAEHFGDTRGQDWYTDLTCLSIDFSSPAKTSVLPNG
jgi:hypothetical protein